MHSQKLSDSGENCLQKMNKFQMKDLELYCKVLFIQNHNRMKKCSQCNYPFMRHSNKYYCCSKQQLFCINCRILRCRRCHLARNNIELPLKCYRCNGILEEDRFFRDDQCKQTYCSKCMIQILKKSPEKSHYLAFTDEKIKNCLVQLPCGDKCQWGQIILYFWNFCFQCGSDYRQMLDYQLKDKIKICSFCKLYTRNKYETKFIKCNVCDTIIKNYLNAETVDNENLTLCKNCFQQSFHEEALFEKQRKSNTGKKSSFELLEQRNFNRKQPVLFHDKFSVEQKLDPQYVYKKQAMQKEIILQKKYTKEKLLEQIQSENQLINQQKIFQQKLSEDRPYLKKINQKHQQRMLQKAPVIQEKIKEQDCKQKNMRQNIQNSMIKPQEKDSQNKKSSINTLNIDEKSINKKQSCNQQPFQELGLQTRPNIKKVLSDQAYIEQLQIQILPINQKDYSFCQNCNTLLPCKFLFDLNQNQRTKNLYQTCSLASSSKYQTLTFICRMCNSKTFKLKGQKFIKSTNLNHESLMSKNLQKTILPKFPQLQQTDYFKSKDPTQANYKYFDSIQVHQLPSSQKLDYSTNLKKGSLQKSSQRHTQFTRVCSRQEATPIKTKTFIRNIDFQNLQTANKDYSNCVICMNQKAFIIIDSNRYCEKCYVLKRPSTSYYKKSLGGIY